MKIIASPKNLRKVIGNFKKRGKSIGFIPTMGFLHKGHLSLVRRARRECGAVLVSIFVNPLQFGPGEDYKKYPRDLKSDEVMLRKAGCDFLFLPPEKHFYKPGFETEVTVKELSRPLCGLSRPTHFIGVATAVLKLLNLVRPDSLYLGQKDYQQFKVIEKMALDLDVPVKVRMAPIVREKDGLAMSSRNVYLSAAERRQAVYLNQALKHARRLIRLGVRTPSSIEAAIRQALNKAPLGRIEYAKIVDAETLEPMVRLIPGQRVLAALAVVFDKTRLIDNILIKV